MNFENDILIVDDEIPDLQLLTGLLEKEGYQVRPADRAQTALDSALAKPPGVILLDVRLPEMDGFELCRRLMQDRRTQHVPIIFISALNDVESRIKGFEAGGVDFISKPFKETEILARVKTHMRLYRMQQHLEQLVDERTAELGQSQVAMKEKLSELEESEERFRKLMDQSPLAIEILTPEGQISQVNPAWLELWDINEEEAERILANYNMLSDDQIKDLGIVPQVERAFAGHAVVLPPIEYDGNRACRELGLDDTGKMSPWVQCHLYPVRDANGKITYIINTYVDITDLKQTEKGLKQSKEFNQSILTSLLDHIAVLDREGKILDVNNAWKQFARENDVSVLDRVGPGADYLRVCREASDNGNETAAAALKGITSVLDGSSLYFEMEYPCEDEKISLKRWYLMTVSPFKGQKGGVVVSHINITSRKIVEIQLRNAFEEITQLKNQLEAERAYLQDEIKLKLNFENIIGRSESIKYVLHRIEQVAPTNSPVLVMGETGTGKELMVRALHELSPQSKRALVKVNCAALPGELIESELFGREKGAYTGATATQVGRFELASGSTLFLDEIGEMPLALQAKLLRVLESGEYERLGSSRTRHSDARIIAATNRVLEEEVRKGRFREDLWYRLKVFPITVPPLRERPEDIPLLVKWFVDNMSKKMGKSKIQISKRSMEKMQRYPWPGNVRELKHVIESALIVSNGEKLNFELPRVKETAPGDFKPMEEMEHEYILQVLKARKWKIGGGDSAASTLGMHVNTLRGRMKKLGITKPKSY